jgi:succinoglycan biosynthesis transport protein ExoP
LSWPDQLASESESPLTFPDFLSTLWRRRLIIVVSIIVAVVAALAYSKLQTPTYQSSALVQIATASQSGQTSSPVTVPDPLQTLSSTKVQSQAAQLLGEPVRAVASAVTGTVDPISGALTVTASDANPARAQAIAKAYSQAYVDVTESTIQVQSNKITTILSGLDSKIAALEAQPINPLITAQIAALEGTYGTLSSEQQNINLGEPYASIQVAAGLPTEPIGLTKSKLIVIGFIGGLLVGCGIALVRDQFDTRLRTTPDIASVTESPILAELPEDNDVRSGKVAIALVQAPQSLMAESVRELRTSLRVILDDTPCPVIVVTSPEPGDGKTFVTANLAASWAMSGSSVIVVSADFRRPRLEEIFGLQTTGQPGFADLIRLNWKNPDPDSRPTAPREERGARSSDRLTPFRTTRDGTPVPNEPSVSSFLVESGIWGLQVLPAGTQLDNPSELFGSPGMRPVLDQFPLLADIVLLDTPPVLAVPDTAILGNMAHGAVIVASEGRTDRSDLERTVRRLETTHCRVLGVAINRVRRSPSDSYQSYAVKQ